MGVYLRGDWYRYKKQIGGTTYYEALKIKRGQEYLLSSRVKQVEAKITARHFGILRNIEKQSRLEEIRQLPGRTLPVISVWNN